MSSPQPPPPSSPAPEASPNLARAPPEPLTGFRASLEHTGLPRGVLTWKPRLPSRNWTIFWTVLGTVSYIYYDDRKKCREIKEEYLRKVEHLGKESIKGSLEMPRKVTVYGAKWPEDEDTDRALRFFRKYVKPYLVAAAVDYEQVTAPLYGSVTREVHAKVLKSRRQALGLEEADPTLILPVALDPRSAAEREVEGGVVLVGRATLKEYLEGLRRGWTGGVTPWEWEKEIEGKIQFDGVVESPPEPAPAPENAQVETTQSAPTPPPRSPTGLGFLSRPHAPVPTPAPALSVLPSPPPISPHLHIAPYPLPPTPPILLLPFTNHLGFKQTPWMIYDFFTEHRRVKAGAEAAYALITQSTRPFSAPSPSVQTIGEGEGQGQSQGGDLDFDLTSEEYYQKSFLDLPDRIEKARKDYYSGLAERLASARALAGGEREMTDEEKKSTKPPVTEEDLKAERIKKELRWFGNLEGWGIVKPDQGVAWDPKWEGWLEVYEAPQEK